MRAFGTSVADDGKVTATFDFLSQPSATPSKVKAAKNAGGKRTLVYDGTKKGTAVKDASGVELAAAYRLEAVLSERGAAGAPGPLTAAALLVAKDKHRGFIFFDDLPVPEKEAPTAGDADEVRRRSASLRADKDAGYLDLDQLDKDCERLFGSVGANPTEPTDPLPQWKSGRYARQLGGEELRVPVCPQCDAPLRFDENGVTCWKEGEFAGMSHSAWGQQCPSDRQGQRAAPLWTPLFSHTPLHLSPLCVLAPSLAAARPSLRFLDSLSPRVVEMMSAGSAQTGEAAAGGGSGDKMADAGASPPAAAAAVEAAVPAAASGSGMDTSG